MWVASLIVASALGQSSSGEPEKMVTQLGASKFAEREQAEAALEQMGRLAMPALEAGIDSKDAEIKTRSRAIRNRIEAGLLTKATLIELDFTRAPLQEVIASVARQADIRIKLMPENDRLWRARLLTIQEPRPLTFWSAIDRICREGRLGYAVMSSYPANRDQTLMLMDAKTVSSAPRVDTGPFRVTLLGLHYQRDVNFLTIPLVAPTPDAIQKTIPTPAFRATETFLAQIQLSPEPRLGVAQTGPLKIIEAVDDLGQSLIAKPSGSATVTQQTSGYLGVVSGSLLAIQGVMKRPDHPGKTIKTFKATVPLCVSTRKAQPLTIALDDLATGRIARNDQTELTIIEAKIQPNDRPATLLISLRSADHQDAPISGGNALAYRRPDRLQQFEVVDTKGNVIPCFIGLSNPEAGQMKITLSPQNGTIPKELRYYGMISVNTEVTFEFANLPMP